MTSFRPKPTRAFCRDCGRYHTLGVGRSDDAADDLIRQMQSTGRLDLGASDEPSLTLSHLFPDGRGQMFGVLHCRNTANRDVFLRAFSSLHEGIRRVAGWAPPILDDDAYDTLLLPGQLEIKHLTRRARDPNTSPDDRRRLLDARRRLSRQLMPRVHDRYVLRNQRGDTRPMREAFTPPPPAGVGLPGGTGDCCAPKLLQEAARQGLRPIGLTEFYWGRTAAPAGRMPGRRYAPCTARCLPILGFMLCGADDD